MLLERGEVCGAASRWNAGVWATSSLVPLANPGLPRRLPGLLAGRSPGFRVDPRAMPGLVPWGARFLRSCRAGTFAGSIAALGALISASRAAHERLLEEAGAVALRRTEGWLHLHRSPAAFEAAQRMNEVYGTHGVDHDVLGPTALHDREPSLARRYAGAVHFTGTASILDPAAMAAAYLRLFLARGGTLHPADVKGLAQEAGAWRIDLQGGASLTAAQAVVAAGPWSAGLLRGVGLRLPMMVERGTMGRLAYLGDAGLTRPVFDAEAGIVLSPRPDGVQVSTGTLLTRPGSPARSRQWVRAEADARAILPLADGPISGPVTADRPTLPDCLPAIGPVPGRANLWVCCGHQHVGFSTSAGSGELLAELMSGRDPPPKLAEATNMFRPDRF